MNSPKKRKFQIRNPVMYVIIISAPPCLPPPPPPQKRNNPPREDKKEALRNFNSFYVCMCMYEWMDQDERVVVGKVWQGLTCMDVYT